MKLSNLLNRFLIVLPLTVLSLSLFSQNAPSGSEFTPQVGQQGKDVVWVPTPQALVDRMLIIAKVTPSDFLIDLGSGDGRTVITAAKLGTKAVGIEYNPDMVELSKKNAAEAGVSDKAEFIKADLFEYDFSKATVITMFLLPDINLKLRPQLLELKPGTRIVSNTFTMDDWQADEKAFVSEDCFSWCTALLWIVPAKVEGTWTLPEGDLVLKQEFQFVTGTLNTKSNSVEISGGRLNGYDITFNVGGTIYTGKVNANTIIGTYTSGTTKADWSATKK